jgi:hypothetical protein
MKAIIRNLTGILILLVFIPSCEKEITNPFDPDCPKEIWTPANFKAVQSENKLDLTWEQDNMNITGFKIDRKVGTQDWSNVASPGKTATSWSDSDLKGGEVHQYRLYACAGDNISNTVTAQATPVFTASLTTAIQTDLSCNSATLGGNISNTGGANITQRGIVYAKAANPTTSDTKVTMGNGEGSFNQSVTGLEETTTFYVRAYAINSAGTSYGNQISFTTPACPLPATVTTSTPTNVTCTSATLGGNITDDGGATVTEKGIVYSTSTNPTTSDTKVQIGSGKGSFSKSVSGFSASTTYYIRAYAISNAGVNYGEEKTFSTPVLATLNTATPTNLTKNSATLGGTVSIDGGATVTERGIVYSTNSNPTTSDTKVVIGSGTGTFSQNVMNLECETSYYVRAYAINCAGTAYGSQAEFKTSDCVVIVPPTVETRTPTSISCNRATLGGNVTDEGGATVTQRGIIISKSEIQLPPANVTKVIIGSGLGAYSVSVTGLSIDTKYYIRAYAINSAGTNYGDQKTFKTAGTATLTTATPTNITSSSAKLGGEITSDGGATVTERGIVYSTSSNPTTADTKVIIGSGTGTFSQNVTNLKCNTTYYFKAYATNCAGTVYGNENSFKTGSCPPNFTIKNEKATVISMWGSKLIQLSCTIEGTGMAVGTIGGRIVYVLYKPHVGIYLSKDKVLDKSDEIIYKEETTLSRLQTSVNISTSKNLNLSSGTYYIIFVADSDNQYDESNEEDNIKVVEIKW